MINWPLSLNGSAVAWRCMPVALPRVVHGAIHTSEKLRMRFALPEEDQVRK